jgi:glycosyltransferase involved in cell wall biosynthesis
MIDKPKVLFIMHMPPPVHGAAMVGKYIHDSKIVNESFDCRFENMMLAQNLEDIGKSGVKKIFNLLSQLKRFKKAIKEFQPDLVYITPNAAGGAFYKDFVIVQYIKRCLKKFSPNAQIVVHYHNKGVASRQGKFLDNILYKKFFKGIKVILLANVLYEDVKKYVSKEDVFVSPNGIPESLQEEPAAERHNEIPKILFLSNLIVSKGVIVLLDALKILKERSVRFACDFVGGETEELNAERFTEEVKSRGLEDNVFYAGRKYGSEKTHYFEKADVFAFPTFYHNETFGLVNLEAMEYKLPIVSTNEGGIPDVVINGENGLICERNNAESLATVLETLLLDKNLRIQYGEKGYKKFKSEFTLPSFENRFVKILKEIVDIGIYNKT